MDSFERFADFPAPDAGSVERCARPPIAMGPARSTRRGARWRWFAFLALMPLVTGAVTLKSTACDHSGVGNGHGGKRPGSANSYVYYRVDTGRCNGNVGVWLDGGSGSCKLSGQAYTFFSEPITMSDKRNVARPCKSTFSFNEATGASAICTGCDATARSSSSEAQLRRITD